MPTCPRGHQCEASDYCEVCGAELEAAGLGAPVTSPASGEATLSCPDCGATAYGRYCEKDGYDFIGQQSVHPSDSEAVGVEHEPPGWTAIITVDRAHFDRVTKGRSREGLKGIGFPTHCSERRIALSGKKVHIGRTIGSRGIAPEIDLSGPPDDAAVSHQHAELLAQADGSWKLVDHDSKNGTFVNGGRKQIPRNSPVPITTGDHINIGYWTRITLQRGAHQGDLG